MIVRGAIIAATIIVHDPAVAAEPTLPSPVSEQVLSEAGGSSTLVHSVTVNASAGQLWHAITTADGWKTWAVPVAWIAETRPNVIETSYNPAAKPGDPMNIENEFVERTPGRTLVFRTIKAPAGFRHFEALRRVTQRFELEPTTSGTRVSLTGTGYSNDDGGRTLLAFFRGGNRVSLEKLRDRFATGPIDWTERLKKPLK